MKTSFRTLFTVGIQHAYYSGACRDFEFVIPPSTADVLRGGKLLRVVDGRLNVLFEVDSDKNVITSVADETLTFGLRLVNPWFGNFTDPVLNNRKLVPFYTNSVNAQVLDAPLGIALVSGVFPYTPQTAARPLDVQLRSRSGNAVLVEETLAAGISDVRFDLRRLPDGRYRIDEVPAGPQLALMVSAELQNVGVWGIMSVTVDAGFYAAPAAFVVNFAARTEHLKYFVVADRFSDVEFAELKVKDTGFGDENRSEVKFDRVPAAEFSVDQGDIFPPALLGDVHRVVMFRSQDPVARRARGLRKIQLNRKEDDASGILIENLPLPAADRPQAHFIVHLSNPRGT